MTRSKKIYLTLGLLNVRSLNTGRDDLVAAVVRYQIDILALNETWLKQGEVKYAPMIPGYQLKLKPRPDDAAGGGVGFYVRKGLRVRVKLHPDSVLEQLWLELTVPGHGRFAIGTAYRPESVSVASAIESLNDSISEFRYCNHMFLLMDLNIDILQQRKHRASDFLDFLSQLGLDLLNQKAIMMIRVSQIKLLLYWT